MADLSKWIQATLCSSRFFTVQDKMISRPSGTVTFFSDDPTNPGSGRIEVPLKINSRIHRNFVVIVRLGDLKIMQLALYLMRMLCMENFLIVDYLDFDSFFKTWRVNKYLRIERRTLIKLRYEKKPRGLEITHKLK